MSAKTKAEAPPRLDAVLRNLAERRTELDKLDDKLSSLIQRIESVLRRQLSTRITRVVSRTEGDDYELLTFGKDDGRFKLLIEKGSLEADGEFYIRHSTPLLSTSRETRTLVFAEGHVEQLLRSANEQLSQQIAVREKALAAAEELARALDFFGVAEDPDALESSFDDKPVF